MSAWKGPMAFHSYSHPQLGMMTADRWSPEASQYWRWDPYTATHTRKAAEWMLPIVLGELESRHHDGEIHCRGCGRRRQYMQRGVCDRCWPIWAKAGRRYEDRRNRDRILKQRQIKKEKQWLKKSGILLKQVRKLLKNPEVLASARAESQRQRTLPV